MAAVPSPGYSIAVRVETRPASDATAHLSRVVASAGGALTALDVAESSHGRLVVDLSCDAVDVAHAAQITAIRALDGFSVLKVSDRTFLLHLGGKIEVTPKVSRRHREDLSRAYTPGVARVCTAIAENPADARRLTIKRNTVAIATDGSAVLGLINVGPAAARPVMEGKAALFKRFADVDAWPVCLDTEVTDQIVEGRALPGAGLRRGQPRGHRGTAVLRGRAAAAGDPRHPCVHDDQHGTPIIRLLQRQSARMSVDCDRRGVVHEAPGLDPMRQWILEHTNPEGITGSLKEALRGADVFIGVSAPDIVTGDDIGRMAPDAVVFALDNPVAEVDPEDVARHAVIVATGRSDFPNQISNVLAFPGVFRGLLDAGARDITDEC